MPPKQPTVTVGAETRTRRVSSWVASYLVVLFVMLGLFSPVVALFAGWAVRVFLWASGLGD